MTKAAISGNHIESALNFIKLFGNAVFISDSAGQAEKLVDETLSRFTDQGFPPQAVKLSVKSLMATDQDQAGRKFQDLIQNILQAEGKISLVITELDETMKDNSIVSALRQIIKEKALPVLGVTDMQGFRRLEESPELSGFLQFILVQKDGCQGKRDNSVLIIGATSFFGTEVWRLFSREYAQVRGTGFSKAASFGFDRLDVTSEDEVKEYFARQKGFDIVVYVSGEADADLAEKEKERARQLNSEAVSRIARHAGACKFVYISSEYVFDGNRGPYGSFSKAEPINHYGRTKLEGEQVSLSSFSDCLVLRLGALYGYNGPQDKKTSVSKLIAGLGRPEPLEADNLQVKHPLLIEDAAATLLKLLDYGAKGIYQVNGPEGLNKKEMAEKINAAQSAVSGRVFSYPVVGIEQSGIAAKPLNTHMVNVDTPRSFYEGVRFLLEKQMALKGKERA